MRVLLAASLAAIILALGAAVAPAGDFADDLDVVAHIFEMADADGDGALSRSEFEEAGLGRYGIAFDGYDMDEDGEASVDEFFDLYEAHHPVAPGELEAST